MVDPCGVNLGKPPGEGGRLTEVDGLNPLGFKMLLLLSIGFCLVLAERFDRHMDYGHAGSHGRCKHWKDLGIEGRVHDPGAEITNTK